LRHIGEMLAQHGGRLRLPERPVQPPGEGAESAGIPQFGPTQHEAGGSVSIPLGPRARGPRAEDPQYFVARVDHAPARWKRPAAQGLTAAEALLLLEGLCDNRVDWLTDWVGRQEVEDGCTGHATRDDGQEGPPPGDDPAAGCASVCGQDGTPPWRSWPLLALPTGAPPVGGLDRVSLLVG
jgi:hypothetical protein